MATLEALPLVVEEGNSPLIEMIVRDTATGVYLSTATVTCTIKDQGGTEVGGEIWPLLLTYVPGSQGVYRAVLEDNVAMIAGQKYVAWFDVTVNGILRHARREVYVQLPDGTPVPATSPESPVFQLPSTQTRYNEAVVALHSLMTGKSVTVVVDQNGERVEFSVGSVTRLQGYVRALAMELGLVNGRPLQVYF